MINKPTLLIVEDEISILRGLKDLFEFHGFDVSSEQDGQLGLNTALSQKFDCIILDVMLPSLDGFSICNAIRKTSREQPIIMLTAKSSEEDIINGLTLGADDYIAKPFSIQELALRVKALVRRTRVEDDSSELYLGENIQIDCVDLSGVLNGKSQIFTRREVDILSYLLQQKRIVSRTELLEKVWGHAKPSLLDTRTVDIHIAKLRKKIEQDCKTPQLLVTIRGEGYKLTL